MKRRELNDVEELIYKTVEDHPGCSISSVYRHLQEQYRSFEYVRRGVSRLIAIKKIRNTGTGQAAALYINSMPAQ